MQKAAAGSIRAAMHVTRDGKIKLSLSTDARQVDCGKDIPTAYAFRWRQRQVPFLEIASVFLHFDQVNSFELVQPYCDCIKIDVRDP